MKYHPIFAWVVFPLLVVAVVACGRELFDDNDDDDDHVDHVVIPVPPLPDSGGSDGENCNYRTWLSYERYPYYYTGHVVEYSCRSRDRDNRREIWVSDCDGRCVEVKVLAYYLVTQDLGSGHNVHVEAFDNPNFAGAPRATVLMTNFKASQGEWAETTIRLPDGTYYLRAYLKNDEQPVLPYQFEGLELIANEPVGVFGALSDPQTLHVEGDDTDPVHIFMDKLFVDDDIETNARIRAIVSVPEGAAVELGRKVHIQLHTSEDFAAAPVYQMEMASDSLLVTGRLGTGEIISDSIPVGEYFVFAYLDANGNGFFDAGELSGVLGGTNARTVPVESDHTRSINLSLAVRP